MMKLEEFVAQTLREIVKGVKSAHDAASEAGARINPPKGPALPSNVEFDVALTSQTGTETTGGLGVFVPGFMAGTQGTSDVTTTSVSRVRFTVPVELPAQGERSGIPREA